MIGYVAKQSNSKTSGISSGNVTMVSFLSLTMSIGGNSLITGQLSHARNFSKSHLTNISNTMMHSVKFSNIFNDGKKGCQIGN